MRIRGFTAMALAVITALTLSVGIALPAGAAAPQQRSAPSSVTVMAKYTLPETSLGSPGFASRANRTVLAWTGTDPAHRLNVEISKNGLTNYGNKLILRQTSLAGPAVAQMSEAAGNAIILAWTGTDERHRLNVIFDVYGQSKKMTYADTSFTSPAITIYKGNLLLAWAGRDPNHSLNVARISLSSLNIVEKRTFTTFSSNEAPTLATVDVEPSASGTGGTTLNEAALGWVAKNNLLKFANTTSGLNFKAAPALTETGAFGPAMMQYHTEGGPEFWITWTGVNPTNRVSLKPTNPGSFPSIVGATSTLSETAFGHPAVGFNNGLLLVWTGTDKAQHLNVLEFTGF